MAFLYRGVHAKHPQIEAARRGVVVPGNQNGSVTPKQHNFGGFQRDSPYTSWTRLLSVARVHAFGDGLDGVVLRAEETSPHEGDSWRWVESPNEFDEAEVLLYGIRIDVEVFEDEYASGSEETLAKR